MCGDYRIRRREIVYILGSPPPVRGLRYSVILRWIKVRITPAYAGTTNEYQAEDIKDLDHPCICGDYQSDF